MRIPAAVGLQDALIGRTGCVFRQRREAPFTLKEGAAIPNPPGDIAQNAQRGRCSLPLDADAKNFDIDNAAIEPEPPLLFHRHRAGRLKIFAPLSDALAFIGRDKIVRPAANQLIRRSGAKQTNRRVIGIDDDPVAAYPDSVGQNLDKVTVPVVIVARCRCFLHIGDKPTQASQFGQQFRLVLSGIACSHAYGLFVQYAPLMLINIR